MATKKTEKTEPKKPTAKVPAGHVKVRALRTCNYPEAGTFTPGDEFTLPKAIAEGSNGHTVDIIK